MQKKELTETLPQESTPLKTETSIDTTESHEVSAELLEAVSPFQGEWVGESGRVIVNGIDISFIHEYDIAGREYIYVYTFYFGFSVDGTLVVNNSYGQARYIVSLPEKGTMQKQSIGSEDAPDTYQYASASTTIPAEKGDPKIGMTESEVYASSWGYPKTKNTTEGVTTREQWVYDFGYIYFTNGVVTSIQER